MAIWRKEEFPQDIHLKKGNPGAFDRQDLFWKVNADTEMTKTILVDDFHIARQLDEKCQEQKTEGACQLQQKFKQSCDRLVKIWAVKIIMVNRSSCWNDSMHAQDDGGVLLIL